MDAYRRFTDQTAPCKPKIFMRISLIVSTYNWKEALDLVFKSITRQTVMPDEILIADDGSDPDTEELIAAWAKRLPVPTRHVWHEDGGFRKALALNCAIAKSSGDYVILVDGDMVLHSHFIEDHCQAARRGYFMQGVRLKAGPRTTKRLIDEGLTELNFFAPDVERRRHTIRNRLLSWLVRQPTHTHQRAVRGCNQAYWREDLVRVNGFNELMVGYGREDNELPERLYNAGIARKNLKFAALAIHLHHTSRKGESWKANDALFRATIETKASWCEHGLDQHLREVASLSAGRISGEDNGR
jgi:glycosyltransferase involved in cell wall biosynthesis